MHRLYTLAHNIGNYVEEWTEEKKLFAWSCFILGMLFFVPSNSAVIVVAGLCVVGLYAIWNNLSLAVLYTYVLFLLFPNGKSISFLLVPESLVPQHIPFTIPVTFSISNFMCTILLYMYLRDRIVFKQTVRSLRLGISDILLGIFLLTTVVVSAFSYIPLLSFLLTLQLWSYVFVYYFIQTRRLKQWLLKTLLPLAAALCTFEGFWSGLQFINNSPLGKTVEVAMNPVLHAASEDTSFFRMQGTFNHPNYLGFFMAVFLPLLLYYSLSKHVSYFGKIISAIGVTLGLTGLILSGSRASWALFAAAVVMMLHTKIIRSSLEIIPIVKRVYLGFICGCVLAIPIFIIPRLSQLATTFGTSGGIPFRWYLLQQSLTVIVQHPLGVGLGAFPNVLLEIIKTYTFPPTEPHNLIAQVFVSSGVIGGISFLGFLYLTIKKFLSHITNAASYNNIMQLTGTISLGVFLFLSMLYPILTEQPIFAWLWVLLSTVV